ncbi:hypothetical protein SAMN04488515_1054 [Cognatiyoonia koreensis]|uniref:Component of SufBCD complex n=1 Tax=Cognatiyoonia koreensis TaxID=364200 RepID=A0A1I0P871_9RHOB|nr:component of SufBCD complex [Cognatiyoonia koreensis]SEW10247.1 hypothetical protein SAMN04488515_1054 [Cognatiyoonia koreensis]
MDWSRALFQVIDLRSFSSLWYWMAVAVVWSSVSHYVLGVPYDMIQRARRHGGQAEQDLHDMVRVCVNRLLHISQAAGIIIIALLCFVLSSLAAMGFWYDAELAQAIFLLAFPMSIVGAVSLATARKIAETQPQGEALYAALNKHRLITQAIGMVAIFLTAMYGMYQNLDVVRGL